MNKPFKILCIDGGGIKGLYSAKVLSIFEETYDTLCSGHFDLICGTSTGGIIALAISQKMSMNNVVDFYKEYGPSIFIQKNRKWSIKDKLLSFKQVLLRSKYPQKYLKRALQEQFGDKTIKDSHNLLCIPAYNMTDASPRIFKKDYAEFNQDDKKSYVEVALATAAAPTYLPVVEIDNIMYADGGLYANNPIIIGLTEALYKWIKPQGKRGPNDFDGVEVLSISSLEVASGDVPGNTARSFWNWKDTLFDSYTIGQNKSSQFFLKVLKNHLDFELEITRVVNNPLSPDQSQLIEMDNASDKSLKLLEAIGLQTGVKQKDSKIIKNFFTNPKTIQVKDGAVVEKRGLWQNHY